MDEFELIRRYWQQPFADLNGPCVVAGIGSDCALLRPADGMELALSVDSCVEGVHFRAGLDAHALGRYALACALSDLAACGAEPLGFSLALSVPGVDAAWLERLSAGLRQLAGEHRLALLGGDTTRGPLSLCVQVVGQVPRGVGLLRGGGSAGDALFVSGCLGGAALRWVCSASEVAPVPRLALGLRLRSVASAAVDVSDGLVADVGHLARASGCRARLDAGSVPLAAELSGRSDALELALTGGGDYELCFAVPAARVGVVADISRELDLPLTRVGELLPAAGSASASGDDVVEVVGLQQPLTSTGFNHFP